MMKFNVGIRAGWSRRDQEGLRAAAAKARSEGLRPRRGKALALRASEGYHRTFFKQ